MKKINIILSENTFNQLKNSLHLKNSDNINIYVKRNKYNKCYIA